MIVSHEHRFIFLRTEKTASTSLTSALREMVGDEAFSTDLRRPGWAKYSLIHHGALKRQMPELFGLHPHATVRQARRVLGKKIFDNYFKFSVERNPWDRQVSLYVHREWKKGNRDANFDRDMRSTVYRATEYTRLNNWSIYAIGDTIVADRVLRYEDLSNELQRLLRSLGLSGAIDLPVRRRYAADRPHYSRYYSDETRELVANWYAREIQAFGYEFEEQDKENEGSYGLNSRMSVAE